MNIFYVSDFFIKLDRQCKPLTLHSSLIDLVEYVKAGIKWLKEENNPNSNTHSA